MQAPTDTYLDDETYAALRAELNRLVANSDVHDADTEIVRILGEVGGIWPQYILGDAATCEEAPVLASNQNKAA